MPFSDQQRHALQAKLRYRHVKSRMCNGATLSYIEGWHAVAEANRIFGFDSWDRKTLFPRCLWRETQRGQTVCLYTSKVRITVRAGGCEIVREGIGTGLGKAPAPELAHEMALKAAETDATKRALATFGNPFGLALYDKEQMHVTRPSPRRDAVAALQKSGECRIPPEVEAPADARSEELVLYIDGAAALGFFEPDEFQQATLAAISSLSTLDALYAFWERNLGSFRNLHQRRQGQQAQRADRYPAIRDALKARARDLGRAALDGGGGDPHAGDVVTRDSGSVPHDPHCGQAEPIRQQPASLAVPKEKRVRDKAHLAFVASQPCLVCGRRPAQAHHLKFAQSRSMALKVSDEFTLPLCNVHHDQLHRSGDERAWWARNGVLDPLKLAARLWAASRGHIPADAADAILDDEARGNVLSNGSDTAMPG